MPSSGRLHGYGIGTLLLGVLLALYGCEGDPQAKKARYIQEGSRYFYTTPNRGIAASLQDLTRLCTGKFACEA